VWEGAIRLVVDLDETDGNVQAGKFGFQRIHHMIGPAPPLPALTTDLQRLEPAPRSM
jgi:hypothetical protein